jgi:hypothetical protein
MDSERFDNLARAVAPLTRRGLSRAVAASMLVLPALHPRTALAAPCVSDGDPCEVPGPACCSGACQNGACLLSPGKPCKKRSQCGSNRCKKVGKRKRRECLCNDGRRACKEVCCTPTQTCEVVTAVGKTCVEEGIG